MTPLEYLHNLIIIYIYLQYTKFVEIIKTSLDVLLLRRQNLMETVSFTLKDYQLKFFPFIST